MTPAIRVRDLSKCFRVAQGPRGGRLLSETLAAAVGGAWQKVRSLANPSAVAAHEAYWALKDVSFDVMPGEVVGIVGRNGAGKSTLLKVLSRITAPTAGRVEVRGRMGSLLEVGTGFHPELTGRENVYLNGAVLGMKRAEIARQFDAIVAFAEVDRFLDTPVKRYSSGMYVRLAFAVAAHLEPEILVVDEVLAVGDVEFQRKCLGKMSEVRRSGRTVLFVSHNMAAVRSLCTRCICLQGGVVVEDADTDTAIRNYLTRVTDKSAAGRDLRSHPGRLPGYKPRMLDVALADKAGSPVSCVGAGEGLNIAVRFDTADTPLRPVLGVVVKDQHGAAVTGINNRVVPGFQFPTPVSGGTITLRYPSLPLAPGAYTLDLYLGSESVGVDVDAVLDAITFEVIPADVYGSGKLPPPSSGPVLVPATWTLDA